MTEYLDALGSPSWSARFHAQATTEPALREILAEESRGSAPLVSALEGLHRCLPAGLVDVLTSVWQVPTAPRPLTR